MKKEHPGRRCSRELKIAAVQRMAAGANVSKLARELGISRRGLYQWQKQFRAGGPAALRGGLGPPRAVRQLGDAHDPGGASPALPSEALTSLRRHWLGSANRSISSDSRRLTSIFQEALQHVGKRTSGAARLAGRHLRGHPVDDGVRAARHDRGRADVRLAGVSRSGYYRYLVGLVATCEEAGLRDAICYRRVAVLLGREAWHVNHKRVLRLMREDNLLCMRRAAFVPMTTDSRHGCESCPIWQEASNWRTSTNSGSPTSPMSTSPRDSPIWLSCSMPSAARSSVGHWRSISGLN